MKKLFVRLTSASFVAVTLLAALAIPAFAATHAPARSFTQQRALTAVCNDNDATCDDQEPGFTVGPNGQACSADGYVVAKVSNTLATVWLYYSPNCETNWADYVGPVGAQNANVQRLNSDGSITEYGTAAGPKVFGINSPMVFAPVLTAQACGSANNDPATSLCTGFF